MLTTTTAPSVQDDPQGRIRTRHFHMVIQSHDPKYEAKLRFFEEVEQLVYCIIGYEKGDKTGNEHMHVQLSMKHARTRAATQKFLNLGPHHCNPTVDLKASIAYCKKQDQWVEFGEPPVFKEDQGHHGVKGKAAGPKGGQMEKNRWDRARELARVGDFDSVDAQIQICHFKGLEHVRERAVLENRNLEDTEEPMQYWWGPTGTGKTRTARTLYPNAFFKARSKWWDGYKAEEVVVIDEIEPEDNKHLASLFKVWLDRGRFSAETKGGSMIIRPRVIILISNYSMEEVFVGDPTKVLNPMRRRCDVAHFKKYGETPEVVYREQHAQAAAAVLAPGSSGFWMPPNELRVYGGAPPEAVIEALKTPPKVVTEEDEIREYATVKRLRFESSQEDESDSEDDEEDQDDESQTLELEAKEYLDTTTKVIDLTQESEEEEDEASEDEDQMD